MPFDFERAPRSAPLVTASASPSEPPIPRLYDVDLLALRQELDALEMDEDRFQFWAALPLKQLRTVLETGRATRIQLRHIRRGLRWAWIDKLGDADGGHFRRLTMRLLAPSIK